MTFAVKTTACHSPKLVVLYNVTSAGFHILACETLDMPRCNHGMLTLVRSCQGSVPAGVSKL